MVHLQCLSADAAKAKFFTFITIFMTTFMMPFIKSPKRFHVEGFQPLLGINTL